MRTPRADFPAVLVLLLFTLLMPNLAAAAWPTDPLVNVPLCTSVGSQNSTAAVSDGENGTIVTWADMRNGSDYDIYAQRVWADGGVVWAVGGVALCTAAGNQLSPAIVSDGAHGAIVTWSDSRGGNGDICAQRISADGTVQWTANGVALCTASGTQYAPVIAPDGGGGAIIAWSDYRSGNGDIYAQHVIAAGAVDGRWPVNGIALCAAANSQTSPRIAASGDNGAYIVWQDYRSGTNYDIYAAYVYTPGYFDTDWPPGGREICNAAGNQTSPAIVSDSFGEAIVVWQDDRAGANNADIIAQRISLTSPCLLWIELGVCTVAGNQSSPVIISDNGLEFIASWQDGRGGTSNIGIYAQRIAGNGSVFWTTGGVALSSAAGNQPFPVITTDGAGGAIVAWQNGPSGLGNADIFAQRILADGSIPWTAGGVALCTAAGDQQYPAVVAGGMGGAVAAWVDYRNDGGSWNNPDIYAQRVRANGNLGGGVTSVPEASALSLHSCPNPFNPRTTIRFDLPAAGQVRLAVYDVAGRLVRVLVEGEIPAGSHEAVWDGRDSTGRFAPSGSYLARLVAGGKVEGVRLSLVR